MECFLCKSYHIRIPLNSTLPLCCLYKKLALLSRSQSSWEVHQLLKSRSCVTISEIIANIMIMIMAGINEPILCSRLCAKFPIFIFALNRLHSTSGLYGGHLLCFGHTVWAYQAHTGNSHHWADPGDGGRGLLQLQKLQRYGKPVFPPQAARTWHVTRTWPVQFPARIVCLGRKQGS